MVKNNLLLCLWKAPTPQEKGETNIKMIYTEIYRQHPAVGRINNILRVKNKK